jgi:hypothetical protein
MSVWRRPSGTELLPAFNRQGALRPFQFVDDITGDGLDALAARAPQIVDEVGSVVRIFPVDNT